MSGIDWMVRHGRSMALSIALKSAPERLWGKEYCDSVTETVLVNAIADRVRRMFLYSLKVYFSSSADEHGFYEQPVGVV